MARGNSFALVVPAAQSSRGGSRTHNTRGGGRTQGRTRTGSSR